MIQEPEKYPPLDTFVQLADPHLCCIKKSFHLKHIAKLFSEIPVRFGEINHKKAVRRIAAQPFFMYRLLNRIIR
ncbi:MAG: hypothetical protein DBY45_08830 [Clostridiales bacterium]|nr:MAG: hypothetical protein DBY45_08830 [Clostridiales bacterium]